MKHSVPTSKKYRDIGEALIGVCVDIESYNATVSQLSQIRSKLKWIIDGKTRYRFDESIVLPLINRCDVRLKEKLQGRTFN